MKFKFINQLINVFATIRLRVLLIALLPLLVCASALTAVTIYLRTQDSESNLQKFAEATIDNLANSAEFGLYSGNIDLLRRATDIPLKNEYVAGIMFYDAEGKLLLSNGKAAALNNVATEKNNVIEANQLRYYLRPIMVFDDDLMDQKTHQTQSKRIGWVAAAISREPLAILHRQILLTSIVAFGVIFSLSLLLSNQIGRSISRPIYKISDAVAEMETGKLKKRAPIIGTRETRLLASTLNRLAERVEVTNQELQQRIALATEKLQQALLDVEQRNSDLEDIRLDLEAALTAKDAFLARMSHELRTPLTSVIGFNRLLDSAQLTPQQRQYTRNIDQASLLLLSTIEDILDFSKLESGAMTLEEIDFDLEQCIEELIALQACNVYSKDMELVLLIDSDVPTFIKGDPVRLKQILNNLLSNAIKFTETGEVILRISHIPSQTNSIDNKAGLLFLVKDSGIGIERDKLRYLFQPFHQADNTISRRFGGTGLGLSICQQLIEQMGGDVRIDSTPGVGTEVSFNIDFPLSNQQKNSPQPIGNSNLPTLIIDSMPWSRRALRNLLSLWLNDIYAVASTEQAVPLLARSTDFGLLVLSLRNSQLNADTLTHILGDLRQHYHGPILLLVGSVDFEGHEFQSIQHQFAPLYLLAKPARRLQMHQAIASIHALSEPYSIAETIDHAAAELLLQNLNVLIVEDNSFNRQLIHSLVSMHGGAATAVGNGAEALEIFAAQDFDIVLIDMHMPVLNGIETTARMRAIANRQIIIVGLTADLDSRNIELMRNAGADVILSKPIDEKILLATLCEKTGRPFSADKTTSVPATAGMLANNSALSKSALLAELENLCTTLAQQLHAQAFESSRETLHQILGLAGLFGMQDMQQISRQISQHLSHRDTMVAQQLLQSLTAQLQQITEAG